jgi:hypothetical protein
MTADMKARLIHSKDAGEIKYFSRCASLLYTTISFSGDVFVYHLVASPSFPYLDGSTRRRRDMYAHFWLTMIDGKNERRR